MSAGDAPDAVALRVQPPKSPMMRHDPYAAPAQRRGVSPPPLPQRSGCPAQCPLQRGAARAEPPPSPPPPPCCDAFPSPPPPPAVPLELPLPLQLPLPSAALVHMQQVAPQGAASVMVPVAMPPVTSPPEPGLAAAQQQQGYPPPTEGYPPESLPLSPPHCCVGPSISSPPTAPSVTATAATLRAAPDPPIDAVTIQALTAAAHAATAQRLAAAPLFAHLPPSSATQEGDDHGDGRDSDAPVIIEAHHTPQSQQCDPPHGGGERLSPPLQPLQPVAQPVLPPPYPCPPALPSPVPAASEWPARPLPVPFGKPDGRASPPPLLLHGARPSLPGLPAAAMVLLHASPPPATPTSAGSGPPGNSIGSLRTRSSGRDTDQPGSSTCNPLLTPTIPSSQPTSSPADSPRYRSSAAPPSQSGGQPPPPGFGGRGGRKLFVGQLPKATTTDELRMLMSPFGSITDLHLIRDRTTGKGTGAAFVVYQYHKSALAAVEHFDNKVRLQGVTRAMHVRLAEGEVHKDCDVKLFVGQLPPCATEAMLTPLFVPFGDVLEVAVIRRDGHSRGCAFVRYGSRRAAEQAMHGLHQRAVVADIYGQEHLITVRPASTEQEKRRRRTVQAIVTGPGAQPAAAPPRTRAGRQQRPPPQQPPQQQHLMISDASAPAPAAVPKHAGWGAPAVMPVPTPAVPAPYFAAYMTGTGAAP